MRQIRIDTPKPRRRRPRHEVLPSIPATPTCFGRSPSRTAVRGRRGRGWVTRKGARDEDYQYFWWIDTERPGRFYAVGNLGQYVYVAPDADAVIVRNGRDWGVEHHTWLAAFREIADRLVGGA